MDNIPQCSVRVNATCLIQIKWKERVNDSSSYKFNSSVKFFFIPEYLNLCLMHKQKK